MRRIAWTGGSTGLASTFTLSLYMAALGVGAQLAPRLGWAGIRRYGQLELAAAAWVLFAPALLHLFPSFASAAPTLRTFVVAAILLVVPGLAHGATLPVLAAGFRDNETVARLYAWNTAGAVVGSLLWPFLVLPMGGVRVAEWTAALLAGTVGWFALDLTPEVDSPQRQAAPSPVPIRVLATATSAGAAALVAEVCASRVGSLLIGGSIYAFSIVLATFLAGISLGAAIASHRRWALATPLLAMASTLVLFTASWRVLPHGVAWFWRLGGEATWFPSAAILFAITLGPVAVASGAAFTVALQHAGPNTTRSAASVLTANTLGSVLGSATAGLVLLPRVGLWGTTMGAAVVLLVLSFWVSPPRRHAWAWVASTALLISITPRWDAALYAVGLGIQVAEFADTSPAALERQAHEGWDLLYSADGRTTTVAVGRSHATQNLWLSLNGKVDASTGFDMPTQELSGQLPVLFSTKPSPTAAVVGLASGVTASRALEAGASSVTVLEIEPEVVVAARLFSEYNHGVLEDPRVDIQIADARAWLAADGPRFDILISEPSNPWLTGVSNLFTLEYWRLSQRRLADDGVFCQWIQLYALPPDAFTGLVRTFIEVYPNAYLFESIPGSDALLVAGPRLPDHLPLQPTLDPQGLARLAGLGPLVTDDHPWVELEAPFWIHRETGATNRKLIEAAAYRSSH